MIQFVHFLILVTAVQGDIFSSTAQLKSLLHFERKMVTTLHEYMEKTESKLSQVKEYLNLYSDTNQDALDEKIPASIEENDINPLQAYQLIRRLAVDWSDVQNAMHSNKEWHPVLNLTQEYKHILPTSDDLQGAVSALIRLQDTYKLNVTEVARGYILGNQQVIQPSARDLFQLGRELLDKGFYAHAIQWLEEAVHRAHMEQNRTASVAEIMDSYSLATYIHDKLFEMPDIDLRLYDTFGHALKGQSSVSLAPKTFERSEHILGPDISDDDEFANFKALCRGEILLPKEDESKLKCRVEYGGHPLFLLGPLKVEERGLNPYVIQYHDVLTDRQSYMLKQIAKPKLGRSIVRASDGVKLVSVVRTSQNAWIDVEDDPLIEKVYQTVQAITGLSTNVHENHVERLQIANYGIGGHYDNHFDYLFVDKPPEVLKNANSADLACGDRIATFMFYLSDVTRGGATVFPKAGASVWPRKGSAVFWYNLKRNGKADTMTLHGACPVAVGGKWVANFWIREKGQMLRRPCALDADL